MKKALLLILVCPSLLFSQGDNGAISGRIRGRDGSPAVGIRVAAVPVRESAAVAPPGAPRVAVSTAPSELSSLAQTDASGNFRLENLPPGRYRVFAGLVDSPTYYPGVDDSASATVVSLSAGATFTGVDFQVIRAASGSKVSGRISLANPGTRAPTFVIVSLLPRDFPVRRMPQTTPIRGDGTFEIANVLPGSYSVSASAINASLARPVTINVDASDIDGVELVLFSTDTPTTLKGLEEAWSVPGTWTGVAAVERAGAILAARSGKLVELDSSGKTIRETQPGSQIMTGTFLRPVRLSKGLGVLAFGTWSPAVTAFDQSGTFLWTYPSANSGAATGIDDAAPVDIDGDGLDEVVVGLNGSTGVHLLNGAGEVIWKAAGIGNVWHVAGGDVQGNGKQQVITTSATGQIHIFAEDGLNRRDFRPNFYANMVRAGKVSPTDTTVMIFAAGTPSTGAQALLLAAFSVDGNEKWSVDLASPVNPSAVSTILASSKPWIAVSMTSGQVYVLDAMNGSIIGGVDGQTSTADLAWVSENGSDAPLLVVSSRGGLRAFRVKS